MGLAVHALHLARAASWTAATTRARADLAAIARAVLREPRLARIVRRRAGRAAVPDQGRQALPLQPQPAAAAGLSAARPGVKTGYTDAAGRCLVATVRRGPVQLGVVLLHSPDPGKQAMQLLDRGFTASGAT